MCIRRCTRSYFPGAGMARCVRGVGYWANGRLLVLAKHINTQTRVNPFPPGPRSPAARTLYLPSTRRAHCDESDLNTHHGRASIMAGLVQTIVQIKSGAQYPNKKNIDLNKIAGEALRKPFIWLRACARLRRPGPGSRL